jgi:CubicO group peptidase (beta-lactamase class C family)
MIRVGVRSPSGAVAVAQAAGRSWEDLSEARLYRPLGMTSTSSRFADYEAATNKAVTHVRVGDRWQPGQVRDPQAQSPAGGVSSTVRDMARWMRLVLEDGVFDGTRIVDADALAAALTPRMTSNPPATLSSRPGSYGYGMVLGVDPTGRGELSP